MGRRRRRSDEEIKRVYDEVDAADLRDGAHMEMVADRLRMPSWKVIERMCANPEFFGLKERTDGE